MPNLSHLSISDLYPTRYGDIIVLLGGWVHKSFIKNSDIIIVKLKHPASRDGSMTEGGYVQYALDRLLPYFNQTFQP